MPVIIIGIIEDVKSYEGKNGFGATVVISRKINKRTKRIEFNIRDKSMADTLETKLDEEVTLEIELDQSSFGIRFGNILSVA